MRTYSGGRGVGVVFDSVTGQQNLVSTDPDKRRRHGRLLWHLAFSYWGSVSEVGWR